VSSFGGRHGITNRSAPRRYSNEYSRVLSTDNQDTSDTDRASSIVRVPCLAETEGAANGRDSWFNRGMNTHRTEDTVRTRFERLSPHLDERSLRLYAAAEAESLGYGGVAIVARATGMSPSRIASGKRGLDAAPNPDRVRKPGGGRKRAEEKNPDLWPALESLVEPTTRGDPESPLRWTCKSTRELSRALGELGYEASRRKVVLRSGARSGRRWPVPTEPGTSRPPERKQAQCELLPGPTRAIRGPTQAVG